MRKRILCAVMSAIMVAGFMIGCGNKETVSPQRDEEVNVKTEESDTNNTRDKDYLDHAKDKKNNYDGAAASDGTDESTEAENTGGQAETSEQVKNNAQEWKQAYIDYFTKVDYNPDATVLEDINDDGIPEVFCRWNDGGTAYSAYYINRNGMVEEVFDYVSFIGVSYGKGYVKCSGGHSGIYVDTVYRYDNMSGRFKTVFSGEYYDSDENGNPNLDENGYIVMRYTMDGSSCEEEEYKDRLARACDGTEDTIVDFDAYTEIADPITAIQNYK